MAFSRKEPILRTQLPVFANGIAGNIGLYQVSQPDSDAISAAVNQFVTDYEVWNNPATRTPGSLETKDASMVSALGICRVFYKQIQINNGISDDRYLEAVESGLYLPEPSGKYEVSRALMERRMERPAFGVDPKAKLLVA